MEETELIRNVMTEFQVDTSEQSAQEIIRCITRTMNTPNDSPDNSKNKLAVELKKHLLDSHVN